MDFVAPLTELLRRTALYLPSDITESLLAAKARAATSSREDLALSALLENLRLAATNAAPLCQDTGFPTFYITAPAAYYPPLSRDIPLALLAATKQGYLRPNAVDSLTGKNSGDNSGDAFPAIHFTPGDIFSIDLLLKGGGCENVSSQLALPYQLPDGTLCDRSLKGAEAAALHLITQAKGFGCAPGIASVHIGGDRATGYALAKKGLLRPLTEHSTDPELAALESSLLTKANALGIGAMGFGGATTLLGCAASSSARLPASYFVTLSYLCWAARRGRLTRAADGSFQYSPSETLPPPLAAFRATAPQNARRVTFPLTEAEARSIRVGDIILVSGQAFLARDRVHQHAQHHDLPPMHGAALYHAGPVALQNPDGSWRFTACGPTTSARAEPFTPHLLAQTGIRAIIGKGGMGGAVPAALHQHGAVYLHAIGGAAVLAASAIQSITNVHYLEAFGIPEALWEIVFKDFLTVCTIDSTGARLE